jgi:hypothetical protein
MDTDGGTRDPSPRLGGARGGGDCSLLRRLNKNAGVGASSTPAWGSGHRRLTGQTLGGHVGDGIAPIRITRAATHGAELPIVGRAGDEIALHDLQFAKNRLATVLPRVRANQHQLPERSNHFGTVRKDWARSRREGCGIRQRRRTTRSLLRSGVG